MHQRPLQLLPAAAAGADAAGAGTAASGAGGDNRYIYIILFIRAN